MGLIDSRLPLGSERLIGEAKNTTEAASAGNVIKTERKRDLKAKAKGLLPKETSTTAAKSPKKKKHSKDFRQLATLEREYWRAKSGMARSEEWIAKETDLSVE